MDPVTHALSGAVLAMLNRDRNAGPAATAESRRTDRGISLIALAGSVFPDIDVVTLAGGPFMFFKYHRGPTHSIAGVVVLSALLAFVFSRFFPAIGRRRLFLWALLGMAAHDALDLLTSYSTFLLLPFSREPFFTGILRFSDRTGWYLFGGAVLAGFLVRRYGPARIRPVFVAAAALLAFGGYVGERARVRYELTEAVRTHYAGLGIERIALTSNSQGLDEWNYSMDASGELIGGTISRSDGAVREAARFRKEGESRAVSTAMKSDFARAAAAFSPFLRVSTTRNGDGYRVSFADMRSGPVPRVRAEVVVNDRGDILEEAYLGFGRGDTRRSRPQAP